MSGQVHRAGLDHACGLLSLSPGTVNSAGQQCEWTALGADLGKAFLLSLMMHLASSLALNACALIAQQSCPSCKLSPHNPTLDHHAPPRRPPVTGQFLSLTLQASSSSASSFALHGYNPLAGQLAFSPRLCSTQFPLAGCRLTHISSSLQPCSACPSHAPCGPLLATPPLSPWMHAPR